MSAFNLCIVLVADAALFATPDCCLLSLSVSVLLHECGLSDCDYAWHRSRDTTLMAMLFVARLHCKWCTTVSKISFLNVLKYHLLQRPVDSNTDSLVDIHGLRCERLLQNATGVSYHVQSRCEAGTAEAHTGLHLL